MLGTLKKQYNQHLAQFFKAEKWFDDPDIPLKDKIMAFHQICTLVDQCGQCLLAIKEAGGECTPENIIKGFEV